MNGPTWSDVASAPAGKIERRDVKASAKIYQCPFCGANGWRRHLSKAAGHRCGCGALFYTQQAVAVHFKERG